MEITNNISSYIFGLQLEISSVDEISTNGGHFFADRIYLSVWGPSDLETT